MKHTKTPIRLLDTHLQLSEDTVAYGAVDRENGIVFTICASADNKAMQHKAAEAAEEIVRCVNSFDALVESLKECMGFMPNKGTNIISGKIYKRAEEALKVAGVEV